MALRKAINNRNQRADTAVRPYAEILHPTGRQYLLQRRGHYAEICIHRASVNQTLPIVSNRISKCAGGRSGPPLRGDYASDGQAENVFVAIRKAISNRNARADTAVRPYAEFVP